MDSWRVLDFTGFEGTLKYRRGQIVAIPREGEDRVVPLADVALVLIGLKVALGPAVQHQLGEYDVTLLACDWRGVPIAGAFAWSSHTRVGARHIAQAGMTIPRKKNAWGKIVRAKVCGQAANLEALGRPGVSRLASLGRGVRSGDPDNVEAQAARLYWARLFADEKFSRVPGCRDPRNSQLDYAYTILRGYAVRAVLSAGLAPSLGLFHRGRSNYFNLVDDIIEPFRPAVDEVVARLSFDDEVSDPAVKAVLVGAAGRAYSSSGHTIPTELTTLAQQLGRYAEGDIGVLPVVGWAGPVDGLDEG